MVKVAQQVEEKLRPMRFTPCPRSSCSNMLDLLVNCGYCARVCARLNVRCFDVGKYSLHKSYHKRNHPCHYWQLHEPMHSSDHVNSCSGLQRTYLPWTSTLSHMLRRSMRHSRSCLKALFFARCCLGKVPGGVPFSQLHKGDGNIAWTGQIMQ